jgi:hypothetical protein
VLSLQPYQGGQIASSGFVFFVHHQVRPHFGHGSCCSCSLILASLKFLYVIHEVIIAPDKTTLWGEYLRDCLKSPTEQQRYQPTVIF